MRRKSSSSSCAHITCETPAENCCAVGFLFNHPDFFIAALSLETRGDANITVADAALASVPAE